MTAAAFQSVALFVWTRHRFAITLGAALYAAALVAYGPLWAREEWVYVQVVSTFLRAAPFFLVLTLFTGAVSVATADLATRESLYPRRFLTLPLSSRQLALPFAAYLAGLYTLLWAAAVWISDARVLYSGPLELAREALPYRPWAPLLHLMLLVWVQALLWTPFRARWLRVALLLGLVAAYFATLIMAVEGVVTGPAVIAVSLASIPAAYLTGARGIARARCGDVPSGAAAPRAPRVRAAAARRFATALDAQRWFEAHVQRGRAGVVTAFIVPLVLLLVVLGMLAAPLDEDVSPAGMLAFRAAGLLLWVFGIVGLASGPAFATFRADLQWHADDAFRMPSFFAALPLSSGQFAWLKLRAAALRMLRIGALVLAVAIGISVATGALADWDTWLAPLRDRFGALEVRVVLTLAAVVFVLMVAAAAANLVWLGLIGRRWHMINCLIAVAVIVAVIVASSIEALVPYVVSSPVLLPGLAAAKLGTLGGLVYLVGARGLYDRSRIAQICGCWLALAVAGLLLFFAYAPDDTLGTLTMISLLVLALPILGLFAAPLALQANRCR